MHVEICTNYKFEDPENTSIKTNISCQEPAPMEDTIAHSHSEHETSLWPMIVGFSVLLSALALLAYFPWQMPTLGIILGGMMLASLAIGITGWAREFFTEGTEEGLGTLATSAFIVSEVMVFGTVFAAFWLARIENFDSWEAFIPGGLDATFALWLTFILWASSLTILVSEKAFSNGNKKGALIWLSATFFLGLLFVVLHMLEWGHLIENGFTPDANIFATTFYGLTGVHTSHVLVGLGIHMVLFYVVASGIMTRERITLYKGAALYWHFVDIMWLLVAANAYLIGGTF